MLRLLLPLRSVMLIASLGAMIGALMMFGLGGYKLLDGLRTVLEGTATVKGITASTLAATDAFLFGIVLVIFAYAIAFGFVLDVPRDTAERLPAWMRVGGISELKHTLVEVILVYLTVEFASDVAQAEEHLSWEALVMPISVFLIAAAMRLMTNTHAPAEPPGRHG